MWRYGSTAGESSAYVLSGFILLQIFCIDLPRITLRSAWHVWSVFREIRLIGSKQPSSNNIFLFVVNLLLVGRTDNQVSVPSSYRSMYEAHLLKSHHTLYIEERR